MTMTIMKIIIIIIIYAYVCVGALVRFDSRACVRSAHAYTERRGNRCGNDFSSRFLHSPLPPDRRIARRPLGTESACQCLRVPTPRECVYARAPPCPPRVSPKMVNTTRARAHTHTRVREYYDIILYGYT